MLRIAVACSLLGLGVLNVGLRGINPFSMESIAFSSPEIPAAGSECPILLLIYNLTKLAERSPPSFQYFFLDRKLTDPIIKGCSDDRYGENTEATPPTSIGSPA